ncbi:MAG: hypothetical protein HWN66_02465 [Candidatus Helarchaeota archaeon]|nr:hypothetical protein [Candidatus Helarchaeota archaeon]
MLLKNHRTIYSSAETAWTAPTNANRDTLGILLNLGFFTKSSMRELRTSRAVLALYSKVLDSVFSRRQLPPE